jgi:hypothetical protein
MLQTPGYGSPNIAIQRALELTIELPDSEAAELAAGPWVLYLTQRGTDIDGIMASEVTVLGAGGKLVEGPSGESLHLSASTTGDITMGIALMLDVNAEGASGDALVVAGDSTVIGQVSGVWIAYQQDDAIQAQERNKDKDKQKNCGKLLWTEEFDIKGHGPDGAKPSGRNRVRTEVYERCVKVTHLDRTTTPPGALEGSPIVIEPDGKKKKDNAEVTAFDSPISNKKVKGGEPSIRVTGEIKFFHVSGCKKYEFRQFRKVTKNSIFPEDPSENSTNIEMKWQADGKQQGPNLGPHDGQAGFLDIPSQQPPEVEKKIKKMSELYGKPIIMQRLYEFETFFYCDGKLIGWYYWAHTASYELKKGVLGTGVGKLIPEKPVWTDIGGTSKSGGEKNN